MCDVTFQEVESENVVTDTDEVNSHETEGECKQKSNSYLSACICEAEGEIAEDESKHLNSDLCIGSEVIMLIIVN